MQGVYGSDPQDGGMASVYQGEWCVISNGIYCMVSIATVTEAPGEAHAMSCLNFLYR